MSHDRTSCVLLAKGSVLSGPDRQLGETLERGGRGKERSRTSASQQESKYGEQHSSRGLGHAGRDLRLASGTKQYISTNNKIFRYNINVETG